MCGIAGLWAPQLDAEERERLVRGMLARLAHRGPDGTAMWSGEGVTLGITRLAIVAPTDPAHVWTNEDGSVHAVVNGEVYNHHDLRAELRARGHDLVHPTDTAVVVHLFEESGAEFPRRIDGMFAVALWDARHERLVLARDRAGEKPLHWSSSAGRVAFASEPVALVGLPWISRAPAPAALARYLAHGFFSGTDAGFADLKQLPPGHLLELSRLGERSSRYWKPWAELRAHPPMRADDAEMIRTTRARLDEAVQVRVPDEVPFGVFLSGGVDSGIIAAMVAREHGRFPTFSLRLGEAGYDEAPYSRAIASQLGTEHHEILLDLEGAEEALDSYAARMDQPLGDPSLLPTWALSRSAARRVRVVLTGEGGDELFAGYPTYLGHRYAALAARLPAWMRRAIATGARRVRPADRHVSLPGLLERFIVAADMAPGDRHLAWFGTASPAEARQLLAPALRATIGDGEPASYMKGVTAALVADGVIVRPDAFSTLAYQLLDFELYLGGGLLAKVDRCTMANGLESRAPFLSHALISYAMSLPERARLRGGCGKWVLKQAARGLLPPSITARRKQGFSPPFSAWVRGPLRARVSDWLSTQRIERAGVLDPIAVRRILDAHLSGGAERGRTLWAILSLQMWGECWVAGGGRPAAAGTERATAGAELARAT